MKNISFILILSLLTARLFAQEVELKALYVTDFIDIIDVVSEEDELLSYAQQNHYNYLVLYGIFDIHQHRFPLDKEMTDDPLVRFITKAKTKYGVKRISVAAKSADEFRPLIAYNHHHKEDSLARIDAFNVEFHFWTTKLIRAESEYCKTYLEPLGLPCTRNGAYFFYLKQLQDVRGLCNENHIELETFISSVSQDEFRKILLYVNTIHLPYYRKNTKNIAKYKASRLEAIINAKSKINICLVFSADQKYMKSWLQAHQANEVIDIFKEQLNNNKSLKPIINNIKSYGWKPYRSLIQ